MDDHDDLWLQRWLPLLRQAAAGEPVLELGCDTGRDTAWLAAQGLAVIGTDISLRALSACAAAVPSARLLAHDLRKPLPFRDGQFGAVIASLCLHYFDWAATVAAVSEVRRVLRPSGVLLCRLNSIRDVLHGAGAGDEIEPHYWRVHGAYAECKRFFDAADLERLFGAQWERVAVEETTIRRYSEPKVCWELVLRAGR